jgi:L-lysine 6-transaminase
LLDRLRTLAAEYPELVVDPRGRGLMCAFSMPTAAQRDDLIIRLWDRRVIMLASGPDSVRFRPALTVSRADLDAAIDAVRAVLAEM